LLSEGSEVIQKKKVKNMPHYVESFTVIHETISLQIEPASLFTSGRDSFTYLFSSRPQFNTQF